VGPLIRAALALVVLVGAGCGSSTSDTGSAPAQPRYDLTITYWPQGRGGPSSTATLTCDPNGGTHPHPDAACAALGAHPEALHPVPLDMACTQIYGGNQVASVSGNGVRALFDRTDGCQIARWDALAPVLEISS
jgi:hypothetical protein